MTAWLPILEDRLEDAVAARARLASTAPHYVYVLCRADGTPFYVGKGVQHRCFHHEAEARTTDRLTHKLNVIRAMGRRGEAVRYCIESSFQTEAEAHARERWLIRLFGRHDLRNGPLTNQTDGGEEHPIHRKNRASAADSRSMAKQKTRTGRPLIAGFRAYAMSDRSRSRR